MAKDELYHLELVGKVLCVKLTNVWSKSLVDQVYSEVQERVNDIKHEPWAAYVDMRNWIMPTFEAFDSFQKIYDWCAQHNQTHEATVCTFATQKRLIGDFSPYTDDFHFFTQTPSAAQDWLNLQGFPLILPGSIG
ncbi:MAG: hypothetical protein ACJA13_003643 [Paraglaciecola sp.]|jgi:hypothetical protein